VRHFPPLILITDRRRLSDPVSAAAALPPGSGVLLRDYDHPDRATLARQLARLCRRRYLVFLVAGDGRLAAKVGADGVHLSEAAIRRRPLSRPARHTRFLTAASHGATGLRQAAAANADACLLSPVFATESHPGARALGPWRFARLTRDATLPVYALGGLDRSNARRLLASGACGIAAIGALSPNFPAPNPAAIKPES
jgi:thiamine-phosphate pyrophosphorylase